MSSFYDMLHLRVSDARQILLLELCSRINKIHLLPKAQGKSTQSGLVVRNMHRQSMASALLARAGNNFHKPRVGVWTSE